MLYIFFNRSIVVKLSQLKKAIVFCELVVLNERHLVALRNKTKENDITAAKM
jgi:hypothetical protein